MKASSKPNPHTRFIPREEIDGCSAWRFNSMDGSDQIRVAAPMEAEPEVDPAQEQALQELRQQAYAEGFNHGHDAGSQETRDALEATVHRSAEETAVRMGQLLHSMTDQVIASEQKIARQVLELACDIARQVIRQELQANTGHLRAVIGESLELIVEDGLPATVRMHPDDLSLMKGALLETLGENAPDFVADTSITPGGCMIQSPSTTVDGTIEKRWSRAIGNLGMNVVWNSKDTDV